MAIKLEDKPRTEAPTAEYPYGNIRDTDTGLGVQGTPMNKEVYADFHQFFAKLLADGEVEANGVPDNAYDGFQYIEALNNIIDNRIALKNVWEKLFLATTGLSGGGTGSIFVDADIDFNARVCLIGKKLTINYKLTIQTVNAVTRGIRVTLPYSSSLNVSEPTLPHIFTKAEYGGSTYVDVLIEFGANYFDITRFDGSNFPDAENIVFQGSFTIDIE